MSDRPTHGFSMTQATTSSLNSNFSSTSALKTTQPNKTDMNITPSVHPLHQQPSSISIAPPAGNKTKPRHKPTTPLGKVVDAGQEHTGRWTREEHEAFLTGLQHYGKEWKKVAAKVKTRTVVQTRTHAQKYFQKMQKGSIGDKIEIDLEMLETKKAASAKKRSTRQKQKQSHQGFPTSILPTTSQKRQVSAAMNNQAAAQLMAMSQIKPQTEELVMLPNKQQPPPPTSTFFTSASDQNSQLPFSRHPQPQTYQQVQNHHQQPQIRFSTSGNGNFGNVSFTAPLPMSIVPPKPEQTLKKNIFPEPSPAACGSRKIIELAAAKVLAGVGNESIKPFDDFSGRTTPPPISTKVTKEDTKNKSHETNSNGGNTKRPAPGQLQIVNPEALGVINEINRSKRRNVGKEPTTPWDGELEALGSEVKGRENEQQIPGSTATTTVTSILNKQDQPINHPLHQSPNFVRSALHTAVCGGSLQQVKDLLNALSNDASRGMIKSEEQLKLLNAADYNGFRPMHSSVSLTPSNMAVVMTHLLLTFGTDSSSTDKFGNTPLHWAARAGNEEVAHILVLKSCSPDIQNLQGELALHWAMRAGKTGLGVVRVLLENGARASLFNNLFQRPIDVAADGFDSVCQLGESVGIGRTISDVKDKRVSQEIIDAKRQSRMNFLCFSPQSRTLLLHHPECLEHVPKSESDWEAPDRVNAIMKSMESNVREFEVQVSTDFDKASLELLSRVHSAEYLTFVNNLSKELEKRRDEQINKDSVSNLTSKLKKEVSVVPFTPMVQRTMGRDTEVKKGSHSDTSFSSGSLRAARRAAGAVQHAVDCVLVGRNRNAFCVVRPPGHHAGINGLLAGGESCGFCIFNNVAAGAMHALSDEGHRPKCERCAIVDIDAHHGNGTEEIVKRCDDPGRLFFFSVHLYDNDKHRGKSNGFKFYPGTGGEDDVAHNIVNVPIAPMWREKEMSQMTKVSQHSYGEGRNTRNKTKLKAAAAVSKGTNTNGSEVHINGNSGVDATNSRSPKASTQKSAPPHFFQGTGREAYRRAIQQRLIPSLRAFNPDLIIISIGFDASKGDVGNAKHYAGGKEAEGINLEPEDYAWTTSRILEVADICCEGRVVSVLEGGYGQTSKLRKNPVSSTVNEIDKSGNMLDKSVFSECAIRHLRAMIDPFDEEKLHSFQA